MPLEWYHEFQKQNIPLEWYHEFQKQNMPLEWYHEFQKQNMPLEWYHEFQKQNMPLEWFHELHRFANSIVKKGINNTNTNKDLIKLQYYTNSQTDFREGRQTLL